MKLAANLDVNGCKIKDGEKEFTLPSRTGTLATLADIPEGSLVIKGTAISLSQDNTTITVTGGSQITASPENKGWIYQMGSKELVSNGSIWVCLGDEISNLKPKQEVVTDPTALETTSTTFISNISQDTNGVITATKKTIPTSTDSHVTEAANHYGYSSGSGKSVAGLFKVTTDDAGHITSATAVQKSDITALGIPNSDTNTHRPVQLNGTQILGNNTTALNLVEGSNISITNKNGSVTISANVLDAMEFKGTLGTGGTIIALPVDGSAKKGDTYKVIVNGTYASQIAKVGDLFICNEKTSSTNTWVRVPSGDEPSGTVTNVATGTGLSGGPITTTGTISHADTSTQESVSNSGRTYIQGVTLDDMGHVIGLSSATETVTDTHNSHALTVTNGNASSQSQGTTITYVESVTGCTATSGNLTASTTRKSITVPANTDTHRPINMNGSQILGNNTTALGLTAGTGISLSNSNGTVTITNSSPNSHNSHALTVTNGNATSQSQGTTITYVESVTGCDATSGNLTATTTRKSVTVPANTDTKVTQTKNASLAEFRPILGAGSTDPDGTATTSVYSPNIAIKPSENAIKVSGCVMKYDSTEECMKFTFN